MDVLYEVILVVNQETSYRILFIANIDLTLFGEKHPSVFRDIEKYESAKILLSKVPFCDNNMYY